MSVTDKKLKREMDLTNLLKSESRIEFEKEHTICYGLYDGEGLEVLNRVKEISEESLSEISTAEFAYGLRARMNSQRNPKFYIMWVHNNSLYLIDKLLDKNDYIKAKEVLIKHGHKC